MYARGSAFLCSLLIAAAACSSSGEGQVATPSETTPMRTVRAFAVSNHILFRDGESIETFDAKMRALFDKQLRKGDIVQEDVDDVASHLLGPSDLEDPVGTARDLVVFTEDVGLILAFQGERAASVRDPSMTSIEALVKLALMHLPQVLLNLNEFEVSINRAVFLALTDKFWRGFDETFSRIADEYDVYLAACENVAGVYESTDPKEVCLYGDPEHPERTNVFLPVDGNVYNQTVIYDPDGKIINRTRKVYLTPPEEDPLFFNLSFGAIEDLKVVDTPVGKLAVMISKDAWMADVIDRADQMGAQVVLQPDANPGNWADVVKGNTTWFPDNWAAGNWMHTQKYPSIRYNVTPMMTGNLYDFNFDGQGSIMGDTREQDRPGGFVGQWPRRGFKAIGRWAIPDPGDENKDLSMEERRTILIERSKAMAPYTGRPEENTYGESVIFADLHLPVDDIIPRPSSPRVFGLNVPVTHGGGGPMWNPSIGLSKEGKVYVSWTDLSNKNEDVYISVSVDGGQSFADPVRVDDSNGPRDDQQDSQWDARIAVSPLDGRIAAVWTDFRDDCWEIFSVRSVDGGKVWSSPATRVDNAGNATETGENLLYDPRVTWDEMGNLFVVWSDNRTVSDTDIFLRKSTDGGASFGAEVRVDDTGDGELNSEPGPTGIADTFAFNPDVVAREGKVYVLWQDMRKGWNAIYFARSDDGGDSFGGNIRVDNSSGAFTHEYFPSIAVDEAGTIYAAWQDTRKDGGDIYLAASTDVGESFGNPVRVDDSGAFHTTQSYPRVAVTPSGDRLYVLWRDSRHGNEDLFIAASKDQGKTFSPGFIVKDQTSARFDQFPGEIAVDASGNALVTWHDSRSGSDAIYLAKGRID